MSANSALEPWLGWRKRAEALCKLEACPSVPGMGRISLDERSQPEPMTVTVAKRKA